MKKAFGFPFAATLVSCAFVVLLACKDDPTYPPVTNNGGGGGQGGTGGTSSGSLTDSGILTGDACVPIYTTFDSASTDLQIDVLPALGTGAVNGTIALPQNPAPNTHYQVTVLRGTQAIAQPTGVLVVSKRSYTYRINGLPATHSDHLVLLRVQVDGNNDGVLGNLNDYDGYYDASSTVAATDVALAKQLDTLAVCTDVTIPLGIVVNP